MTATTKSSTPTREEVRDLLLRAKARVERVGWQPNGSLGQNGERCAHRSMVREQADAGIGDAVFDHARAALERAIGGRATVTWNDAPGRTQAEVVAALQAAADLVMKEES